MMRKSWLVLLVAAAWISLASCSAIPQTSTISASGVKALPDSTAEDWVTYADHAAIFTVVGEQRTGKDQETMREVTVEIQDPFWSREGAAEPLPQTLVLGEGQVDLEVGSEYLAAFTFTNLGGATAPTEWVQLGILPLNSDGVVAEQPGNEDANEEIRRQLQGKTPLAVGDLLRSTNPDPRAAPFYDLDPADRYQEVISTS